MVDCITTSVTVKVTVLVGGVIVVKEVNVVVLVRRLVTVVLKKHVLSVTTVSVTVGVSKLKGQHPGQAQDAEDAHAPARKIKSSCMIMVLSPYHSECKPKQYLVTMVTYFIMTLNLTWHGWWDH